MTRLNMGGRNLGQLQMEMRSLAGAWRRRPPTSLKAIVMAAAISFGNGQSPAWSQSFHYPVTTRPQSGVPCGHYGTPACDTASPQDLEETAQGMSGQALWERGTALLASHNAQSAAQYFKRAAEMGNGRGEAAWGEAQLLGRGTQRDASSGLNWIEKSAAGGDRGGEFVLGQLYASGQIVSRDPSRAARLYQASARQSFGPAERELGVAYELGNGVPRSRALAISWLRSASRDQNGDAWTSQVAGYLSRPETPRFSSELQLFSTFNVFIANYSNASLNAGRRSGGGLNYGSCSGIYAQAACAHSAYANTYQTYQEQHPPAE